MNFQEAKKYLNQYGKLLDDLINEKIVRTYNSPIGDYAEWLFKEKFNFNCPTRYEIELKKSSKKDYDAENQIDHKRYQIKACWKNPRKTNVQFSMLRNYDVKSTSPGFDYLILIVFKQDFSIEEAWEVEYQNVEKVLLKNNYQNGNNIKIAEVRKIGKDISSVLN